MKSTNPASVLNEKLFDGIDRIRDMTRSPEAAVLGVLHDGSRKVPTSVEALGEGLHFRETSCVLQLHEASASQQQWQGDRRRR